MLGSENYRGSHFTLGVGETESRRDQEEGDDLDSHTEVRRFCRSRRDQEEGSSAGPSS